MYEVVGISTMKSDLSFNHLFAVVASLEKCISHSEKMLLEQTFQPEHVYQQIEQQRACVEQMQTVANRIQLEALRKDWRKVVRSFQVFYGLNTMVRPEIITTFSTLSRRELCIGFSRDQAALH